MTRGRWALSALLFCGILVLGWWPVRGAALAFSRLYCPLGNIGMTHLRFGTKGRARFLAPDELPSRPHDSVVADGVLALSLDGVQGELPFGISLRRDVYLPWLLLVAALVAAPVSPSLRMASPLCAAVVVWAASVGAYALFAMWIFVTQLRGASGVSPPAARLIELAAGALLFPPGNRFIAPLGLGCVMVLLDRRTRLRRP